MSLNLDKSGWKRVALGDVIKHVTDRVDAETSGLERFLAGEHIPSNSLHITKWGVIGRDPIGPMFYKRFRPGHVLYVSRRSYLRKTAVPEFEGITGEKTFVLETRDPDILLQEFMPFLLSAEAFHSYAVANSRGSVNPYVNWTDLASFQFDLPPIDEQKRLAELFWAIERHRRNVPIGKLSLLEVRMLEQLLDADVGGPARIDSLGTVLMGRQRSPKHAHGDHMIPYLRVANIGDDELRLSDVKRMNFSPDEQENFSVLPNDILISEGQSRELVGQSALVTSLPEPMCFQNTLIRFRPNLNIVRPAYAQALFRACLYSGKFADLATQTTSIAHLGVARFAMFEVRVPDIPMQDHFLSRLGEVRAAIRSAKAELASLSGLSDSLAGRVFGGVE
ncbi:restriction endonuclease subunit S [Micromonospora sp. WMMD712]|uniref:restriction endonuclease subunit S n=1 Tax=Micromonospora sp. WMMD712 TaxID=3016096 RepID=UPI00249CE93E|nr:restriction endonuclease subunit S [Micromonospora sp. WMMD712]WFE60415.1 restriction endonuclease subunit S [Micromonospora sp. WMMD712]